MFFPGLQVKNNKSKFLIPQIYLKALTENRTMRKSLISEQNRRNSKNFQSFTLTNSGTFSARSKPSAKSSRKILKISTLVDKAVGTSTPLFEKNISSLDNKSFKNISSRAPRVSKMTKRYKSLNITSPVFSLRKDFKVVLAGEHVMNSIVLKS